MADQTVGRGWIEVAVKGLEKVQSTFSNMRAGLTRAAAYTGFLNTAIKKVGEVAKATGVVFDNLGKTVESVGTKAKIGFAAATASMFGFAKAADPYRFMELQGTLAEISVQIGSIFIPILDAVNAKLREVLGWLRGLSNEQKDSILKWASIGTAVLGVVALIPRFIALIRLASGAMAVFGAITSFSTGGISTLLGAIAALVGGFVAYEVATGNAGGITATFQRIVEAFGPVVEAAQRIFSAFTEVLGRVVSAVVPVVQRVAAVVARLVSTVVDRLLGVLLPVVDQFVAAFTSIWEGLAPVVEAVVNVLAASIEAVVSVLGAVLPVAVNLFRVSVAVITGLLRALGPVLGVVGRVLGVFGEVFAQVAEVVAGVVTALAPVVEAITEVLVALADVITSVVVVAVELLAVPLQIMVVADVFEWFDIRYPGWAFPKLFFRVKALTMCRLEDLCSLPADAVVEAGLDWPADTKKNRKAHFSALPEAVVAQLRAYRGKTWLWEKYAAELVEANKKAGLTTHRANPEFDPHRLYLWVVQIMQRYQKATGKKFSSHDFKRAGLTRAAEQEIHPKVLAAATGTTVETILRYYTAVEQRKASADVTKRLAAELDPTIP